MTKWLIFRFARKASGVYYLGIYVKIGPIYSRQPSEMLNISRSPYISGIRNAMETLACPLCEQPVAVELYPLIQQVEASSARRLQGEHPGWRASDGACPECVQRVASSARLWSSEVSIQEELLMPYPVYTHDDTRLLPTPQRTAASPQYTGRGVTLAFLDSGFYPHPDLTKPENRILAYADATGDEPDEKADFSQAQLSSWHGLMTSCVAAGNGLKSDYYFRGIAHQANLVLVKSGHLGGRNISDTDIQRALAWTIANQERFDVRVINISLGGDQPANGRLGELDRLVEDAVARGMVVVAAAGNSGTDRLIPPASAPSAITVGGLDDRNTTERHLWRMYHSSYGLGASGKPKPEMIAPAIWLAAPMLPNTRVHNEGKLLWQLDRAMDQMTRLLTPDRSSLAPLQAKRLQSLEDRRSKIRRRMIDQKFIHPHYQHVDGTSMAAPVVTSIIAQMLEANPALTPIRVKKILMTTAVPLTGFPVERQGAGVVNPRGAIAMARRSAGGDLVGLPLSPYVQARQVVFIYYDPGRRCREIALIGSFNGWNPDGASLQSPSPGLWQISIPRPPPGQYRYKFLVDSNWIDDPENSLRIEDGYGGYSSILEV